MECLTTNERLLCNFASATLSQCREKRFDRFHSNHKKNAFHCSHKGKGIWGASKLCNTNRRLPFNTHPIFIPSFQPTRIQIDPVTGDPTPYPLVTSFHQRALTPNASGARAPQRCRRCCLCRSRPGSQAGQPFVGKRVPPAPSS